MTDCNKPVKRRVRFKSNWLPDGQAILTVYPHGELGFREPHRRTEYKLSMTEAYRQAVLITTARISNRVKALRKEGLGLATARKQARREVL